MFIYFQKLTWLLLQRDTWSQKKTHFKVKDMYLFNTHFLRQFDAAVAFIVLCVPLSPEEWHHSVDSRSSGFPTLVRAGGTEKRWVGQHFFHCFKSPSVCCIMGLFTSPCVSHLPLLNPGQSPSRFPRVAGVQAATPLHIFISSAVPQRLIFFIFLALHLSVEFSRFDIDFHFLSPRPLPLTAHQ